ncbi:alpha/beta fold hydrolase [Parafilimonas sp.]|uniref:alpha/beta fold hydrolase n=1 Tax=Parafilimonas sp. TaxID=1969739 RepID=UPI0039E604A9
MIPKALFSLISCCIATVAIRAQPAIHYGNNPATGKYYKIRGIKMYCEIYGNGEPLLMIHGNGGSISAFSSNIPYFAQKYKVIAADSRSQGRSTDTSNSLSFEMMADDFAALLDTLHIQSAYIVGWSDGGINALLLAMRHPQKVKKIAATGANLWPDSTALLPSLWKDMNDHYSTGFHKNAGTAKDKNDWKLFMLDFKQPHISLSSLKKIKCPALIIGGDHDLIPVQHTALIAQNIPGALLWIVPNSGHATLQEHKEEFNKKVDAFFSAQPAYIPKTIKK